VLERWPLFQRLCDDGLVPCGTGPRRRSLSISGWRWAAALRVSGSGRFARGWLTLLRTALRQGAEREPDAFDRLLLPNASTTNTRASCRSRHLSEACASPLRPRACALDDGDRGTWRFKTPDPLRRIVQGWRAAYFFRVLPERSSLWHPCRGSVRPVALTRGQSNEAAEIVLGERSVKILTLRRPRMPSIDSPPRSCAVHSSIVSGHVMLPLG